MPVLPSQQSELDDAASLSSLSWNHRPVQHSSGLHTPTPAVPMTDLRLSSDLPTQLTETSNTTVPGRTAQENTRLLTDNSVLDESTTILQMPPVVQRPLANAASFPRFDTSVINSQPSGQLLHDQPNISSAAPVAPALMSRQFAQAAASDQEVAENAISVLPGKQLKGIVAAWHFRLDDGSFQSYGGLVSEFLNIGYDNVS